MARRFLISIGINDYVNFGELDFCVKDATDMMKTFQDFCNVDSNDCRLITTTITQPNINPWGTFTATVEELKQIFTPEDDIIVYFSGHGILSNETTIIFKSREIKISEIIHEINKLNPKTKLLFFDSCHSGVGFTDNERSAQYFNYSTNLTSGYFLICSCSENQKAKESTHLKNGRFTSHLISCIKDLKNYNDDGILDVNRMFSLIDTFFKSNPDFKQNPYQQIRSVGSYPLANNFNDELLYTRFDISNEHEFEWTPMLNAINLYLQTSENIIGEFFRLIREHCDNTLSETKGNAKLQHVEISRNKVTLIDNGRYFDLLNPSDEVKAGGGIATAKHFKKFDTFYTYESYSESGLNFYTFTFRRIESEPCKISISWPIFNRLKENFLTIPDNCVDYTVRFEKYMLIQSFIPASIASLVNESKRTNKIIYFELHEDDSIVSTVEFMIEYYKASDQIKLKTYRN